jgi:hypothetical protein
MDIVLKIIVKYNSLRDFAPYQLGEMIYLNLVVKNSHSPFDILFFLALPQMCTQPN